MIINIKTSRKNQEVVTFLTQKLPGNAKENIIARIALGYSLSLGKRFTPAEFNTYDSQGKEYKDSILFDVVNKDYYIALICQAYGINKNNDLIPKYVKLHVDHILLVSKDGKTVMNNLRTLCSDCNLGKSDKYDESGDN